MIMNKLIMMNNINDLKFLYLIIIIFSSLQCFSQKRDVLILWDVTYSMKGQTAAGIDSDLDIWDETKELIIAQIDNMVSDGISTIHILPFQNPSDNPIGLDWEVEENINDLKKSRLQKWVKDFEFPFNTHGRSTNLCGAIDLAMDKITSLNIQSSNSSTPYSEIIFALYSDGAQSSAGSLKGVDFNYQTCLQDRIDRFCIELCPILSGNRMYILKLKSYNSNMEENCDCVIVEDTPPLLTPKFRMGPSPKIKKLLFKEAINTHTINVRSTFGSRPLDLSVKAVSNNTNISINEIVNIDSDGNFIIEILTANVPSGGVEEATINFNGNSTNELDITIEPIDIIIVNEKKSKVTIKGIKIEK